MTRQDIMREVQKLSLAERKQLLHDIIDSMALETDEQPSRTPGLHAGMIHMSDDFDAPLPDEFWLGEE